MQEQGIDVPVINIPGCPPNPEWLVAVLVDVVLMQTIPQLNEQNKPAVIFNETIHDNCERRGHFENGEFVYEFGSKEEALGYCLYPLGCKGPQTKANCGVTLWNNRRSWCIQAGSPCLGCCEANPNDPGDNWVEVNTPFYERHRDVHIGNWFVQPTVIAGGLTALVAAALVVHGFGMKAAGRMDGGADFEKVRAWDAKNPEKSIGQYEYSILDGDPVKLKDAQEAIKADYAAAAEAAEDAAAETEEGR
jgi:hydrogenase small subunit